MSALLELDQILKALEPQLDSEEYVFATFPGAAYGEFGAYSPFACVQEEEGLTLVFERSVADSAGIPAGVVCRRISLTVHSSLEAVGLTAAVAGVLAENNISANMVAGYFHDHVFVPRADAEKALRLLESLSCDG